MAGNPGNVILLTSPGEVGTVSRDLYNRWEKGQNSNAHWGKGKIGQPSVMSGDLDLEVCPLPVPVLILKDQSESTS